MFLLTHFIAASQGEKNENRSQHLWNLCSRVLLHFFDSKLPIAVNCSTLYVVG